MNKVITINSISFLTQLIIFEQTRSVSDIMLAFVLIAGIVYFHNHSVEAWRKRFYFYLSLTTLLFSVGILIINSLSPNNGLAFSLLVLFYLLGSAAFAIKTKLTAK